MFTRKLISALLIICVLTSVFSLPAYSAGESNTDLRQEDYTADLLQPDIDFEDIQAVIDTPILNSESMSREESIIFEHIDKEVFDSSKHISRLYDEEKSNTYVFLNQDGTKSVYFLDEDVKFTDES